MGHIVNLEDDSQDNFDCEGKNVGKLTVLDKEGIDITSDSRVILEMSEEGLLGLGVELIRLSKRYRDGSHYHIYPSKKEFVTQSMGIFLTPKSCELIFSCREFSSIENYFEENE